MKAIAQTFGCMFLLALSIVSTFSACGPNEEQKKKTIATRIGHETCYDISNISISLVGGIVNSLIDQVSDGNISNVNTGSLGKMPESWCNCYTYYVVTDLTEKFSYRVLVEIKRDKGKQIMVLRKIVEVHQEDVKQCIAESTGKMFKDYSDFERDLDERFKK